jgi:hypothetical protein
VYRLAICCKLHTTSTLHSSGVAPPQAQRSTAARGRERSDAELRNLEDPRANITMTATLRRFSRAEFISLHRLMHEVCASRPAIASVYLCEVKESYTQ